MMAGKDHTHSNSSLVSFSVGGELLVHAFRCRCSKRACACKTSKYAYLPNRWTLSRGDGVAMFKGLSILLSTRIQHNHRVGSIKRKVAPPPYSVRRR